MRSARVKSPCLGCEDRSATCHATCEKYKEFAAINKADREKYHDAQKKLKLYRPIYQTKRQFDNAKNAMRGTIKQHKK